LTAVLENKLYQ